MCRELREKMARDISLAIWGVDYKPREWVYAPDERYGLALKAADAIGSLLSDPANITNEMVFLFRKQWANSLSKRGESIDDVCRRGIAAAFSERAPSDLTKEPKP